ncbi:hypothetical protein U1Q18_005580 [Sarracenia purpurea var. burkii]
MEGDDEALAKIIDNIYANIGNDGTQHHRPIINGERLDVEPYVALYNGRTKITCPLFIADHRNVFSMQLEVIRVAYDEVKRGENA